MSYALVNAPSAACASNEPVKKNVNRACTRGESGEFALTAALNQDSRVQVQSSVQAIVNAPSVRFGLLGLQSDPTAADCLCLSPIAALELTTRLQ